MAFKVSFIALRKWNKVVLVKYFALESTLRIPLARMSYYKDQDTLEQVLIMENFPLVSIGD